MRSILVSATLALSLLVAAPQAALAAGKKKNESAYVPLRAVTLTIVRPTGRRGAMTVEMGLNAPDPHLRDRAAASGPLLRDAYISALQPYAMRLSPGTAPNAELIAQSLQRETDRVLGRSGARVLLGAVLIN